MVQKFPRKIPETVAKCEQLSRKFMKFRKESWMERKLPGKSFPEFGYTSRGCALFGNFGKYCSTRSWKLLKFKPDFLVEWKAPKFSFVVSMHILYIIIHVEERQEVKKSMMGDHDLNSHQSTDRFSVLVMEVEIYKLHIWCSLLSLIRHWPTLIIYFREESVLYMYRCSIQSNFRYMDTKGTDSKSRSL